MYLTPFEQSILDGDFGRAARKAMEILVALGAIYDAERMVAVTSVQISGVSYDNLGEAGLKFLADMADGGGKTRVLATLNPAGLDVENWQAMGIDKGFAENQKRVIDAYARMGVATTCSCTPYLTGNLPHYGEHIAWAESSAVCFANSIIGARTNREGGPSSLAAALTGRTPEYGYHLDQNRLPTITLDVETGLEGTRDFGALGVVIGRRMESLGTRPVAYIRAIKSVSLEDLKSFCASIATHGGAALFHMEGITPEAVRYSPPVDHFSITHYDLEEAIQTMNDPGVEEIDFVSLGCPHLSLNEIAHLAGLLQGKRVKKEFWITTSRPVKQIADRIGYSRTIEEAGAIFAVDTCCVVSPIKGRFKTLATDSAKACYYAASKNQFKTLFLPFDQVVEEALR